MQNKEIIVTDCDNCPFAQRDNAAFDFCGIEDEQRRIPRTGTPDWCPLNTQVLTIRLDKPAPEFEEGKPRIKEV